MLKIVDALLTNTSISADGEQSSGESDGLVDYILNCVQKNCTVLYFFFLPH